jgi:hypothetical protein
MTIAIHVRIGVTRSFGEKVQAVIQSETIRRNYDYIESNHDKMTQVLVVDQYLDEQSQHTIPHQFNEASPVQFFQVLSDLKIVITKNRLQEHPAQHDHEQKQRRDQH